MKIRTSQTVVSQDKMASFNILRKKWVDLRKFGQENAELLGHLKVVVPIGINLVEFGRTKKY